MKEYTAGAVGNGRADMKALMIGAARSGIAAAKLLNEKGYEAIITDLKEIPEKEELEALGIRVYDGGHPDFLKEEKFDLIVKNPGIPDSAPFVKAMIDQGYFMYNETEIAARYAPHYRFGAITGTNGKTTTTTLLGEMLKTLDPHNGAIGNNGFPVCETVRTLGDGDYTFAVEIAAFQLLGTKDFHPVVSVCTNLTPDHLNVFGTTDAYYKAKMLVWQNQTEDDWFITNADDPNCMEYARDLPCRMLTFSLEKDADICLKDGKVMMFGEELFDTAILRIPGMHNIANAMCAAAMAVKLGVSRENIVKVLSEFPGVEHRIQFITEKDGVRYYNDSKGTVPEATIVALKAFPQPVILLGGGYDKKTGFAAMKPYLDRIKYLIAFGATKYQLKDLYPDAILVENLEEAVAKAHELAKDGDIVLLSPMCASWDQFPSYEVRGHRFAELVKEL